MDSLLMKSLKKETLGSFYTPPILAQFVVWSAFQQFFRQRLPYEQWANIRYFLGDTF